MAWAIARTWMISRSLYSMSGASAFVASSCGFTPRESATTATKEGGMGILSKEMATRLGTLGARWMSQWCLSGIVAAIQRAVGSLGSTLISLSTSSFCFVFCDPNLLLFFAAVVAMRIGTLQRAFPEAERLGRGGCRGP